MPHIQVHVGMAKGLRGNSEAYSQAPLPWTAGPPHRACIWSQLELGPFQVPHPWWPPLNGDPLASLATRGGSLVV